MVGRSFFSRLLGGDDAAEEAAGATPATSPAAAPAPAVPTADAAGAEEHSFIRREALLDRKERIVGYEFSLRLTTDAPLRQRAGSARRDFDKVLLERLAANREDSLLGQRLAFLRLSPDALHLPVLERLGALNTVLILDGTPQSNDWAGTGERLAALRQRGYALGLHVGSADDAACPLIGGLDYLQVNVAAFDGFDLQTLIRRLPKEALAGKLKLIAAEIQSHDDFLFCVKCSFDLYQGPFITQHDAWRPARGGINRSVAMPILAMIRSDAEFAAIAEQLKREPTLTYKLLRYLNSPAIGLQRKVENLTQALVIIGRDKFYRWMSLLLFHFEKAGYRERMLTEQALARGRTLELLAGKGKIPATSEHLFLIGLFSLLDIVMGQPLPDLLAKASVPEPVRDALIANKGVLAEALHLAILGEAGSLAVPAQFDAALQRCGLTDAEFAPVAAQALVWANEVVQSGED